ncbi:hypothetical protein C453_18555 [Haloferax elongans ATCC BAA-1513]|uniref:Halobacterial output domain-containing protein n=1 Tax=Haloferax elongans ATCC BAA-1513 TaxID=1230453 RepID=M0H8V0_HALEO|nr:hypothetical protein C453_18555 [Haloferax elongans ATCC BAA-1513]
MVSNSTGSCGEDGTIRAWFDWETETPSAALVEVLAIATDSDPTKLGPLNYAIDLDALDALVQPMEPRTAEHRTTVSFSVSDRRVTIHNTGEVVVQMEDLRES